MQKENRARIKKICKHDYGNAIQVGEIDYQCSLCGQILDPMEWFLMNSFEFIDVRVISGKRGEERIC